MSATRPCSRCGEERLSTRVRVRDCRPPPPPLSIPQLAVTWPVSNKKSIGKHRRRRKIVVGYTRIQVTVVWCPSPPPGRGGTVVPGGGMDMAGGGGGGIVMLDPLLGPEQRRDHPLLIKGRLNCPSAGNRTAVGGQLDGAQGACGESPEEEDASDGGGDSGTAGPRLSTRPEGSAGASRCRQCHTGTFAGADRIRRAAALTCKPRAVRHYELAPGRRLLHAPLSTHRNAPLWLQFVWSEP